MRAPYGHRLTDHTDGPFRLCECGIGIAVDPRDELKVYRRHRLHLEAVEHVDRADTPLLVASTVIAGLGSGSFLSAWVLS